MWYEYERYLNNPKMYANSLMMKTHIKRSGFHHKILFLLYAYLQKTN